MIHNVSRLNCSHQDFFRHAHWSADDRAILCQSEKRILSVHDSTGNLITPISRLQCASACLCAAWYPLANSDDPSTFCYVRSIRDAPIALIDGKTAKIRASYSIIDHTERFIGPHSLLFSTDCAKLYCGHENAIEIFDFAHDGQSGTRFGTTPNRRSKDGQKGIVSALAIHADTPNILAAGTFSRSVGLYDLSSGLQAMQIFIADGTGVTQLRFHPSEPQLFVNSRHSDYITCFDIRQAAVPLVEYTRPGRTNQRLHFDIDSRGDQLVAGDRYGNVRTFVLKDDQEPAEIAKVSSDSIGSVQISPISGRLLIASGSRRCMPGPSFEQSSDESEVDDSHETSRNVNTAAEQSTLSVWERQSDADLAAA